MGKNCKRGRAGIKRRGAAKWRQQLIKRRYAEASSSSFTGMGGIRGDDVNGVWVSRMRVWNNASLIVESTNALGFASCLSLSVHTLLEVVQSGEVLLTDFSLMLADHATFNSVHFPALYFNLMFCRVLFFHAHELFF